MIPRRFSRAQVVGLCGFIFFVAYEFHSEIKLVATNVEVNVVQPYGDLFVGVLKAIREKYRADFPAEIKIEQGML